MSLRSVIHDTFTIERTYPVPPARVFAAFTSADTKSVWGGTGNLESADREAGVSEFDFCEGGRERFGIKMDGTTFRYDRLSASLAVGRVLGRLCERSRPMVAR